MPTNLEISAVATGLEKVSFHSNPKERQCKRMLKLPHNCTHLTRQQSNTQTSPSQASTVPLNFQMLKLDLEKAERNQRSNCQQQLDHRKSKSSRKTSTSALLPTPKPLTVQMAINWKILKEMGIPDHLTCLLRNLYSG